MQPSSEPLGIVTSAEVSVRTKKGRLEDIFGLVGITNHPRRESRVAVAVAMHQLRERSRISLACVLHERAVCRFIHPWGDSHVGVSRHN